ncbi:MAG: PQQ-dependent sugar dehydrogenase [Chloroflexota bacterium]
MRSSRLITVLLSAIVLVVGVGDGALAGAGQPAATASVSSEQAAQPSPTTAFTPTECPVEAPAGVACGLVSVPQRHAAPDDATPISLGVVRVPATESTADAAPVVILSGGMDGSALDLAPSLGSWQAAFPGRDLVLMDHRGGRYSTPFLQCGEDDSARVAEALGQVTGTAALDAHVAAWTACATRLRDAGFDLAAFDAPEAAADIADVVSALGYADGFDLVAIGDGTRAGFAALRAGLPGLRSVTLDSAVVPQVSATAALPGDAWSVVQHLSAACEEDEGCAALVSDLAGTVATTAAALDASPAQVTFDDGDTQVDAVVDGAAFVRALISRFADATTDIAGIPPFVAAAAGGDLTPVARVLLARARDTSQADVLAWTLRCTQDAAGTMPTAAVDMPASFEILAGRVGDRDGVADACAALGVADAGGTLRGPATGDVPVLALNGEYDPWSMPEAVDQARSGLTTSYGLVLPAIGHATLVASDCALDIAGRFVADPANEPDASCIADMPEFAIGAGGPEATDEPDASTGPEPSDAPSPAPSATPKPAKVPKVKKVDVGLVKVADGFENANGIVNAGDKRLFVVEQEGYVIVLKPNKDGTYRKAGTFLDIRSRVICCGEKGMLGLAFPPDYAETGYFYVTFAGTGHTWNLEERRVSRKDPDRADPDYKRKLIRVYKPRDYHWAGDMHFGPDGYLYVTIGDGGFGGGIDDPGDPENRAQDLGVIFGKMLRISPRRGREDGARYGIPATNPFVDKRGAEPEIWAYGLRNPWRWSFDRVTGDLWIGDVGMWRWEEVNRAKAPNAGKGLNFGWRRMEGPVCYNPPKGCDTGGLTKPFATLAHRDGVCAVTGGYVYRGERYPRLRSWYVFADYCSGRIYLLDSAGKRGQKPKLALDTKYQISALGEDAAGELYIADYGPGNTIYRITGTKP